MKGLSSNRKARWGCRRLFLGSAKELTKAYLPAGSTKAEIFILLGWVSLASEHTQRLGGPHPTRIKINWTAKIPNNGIRKNESPGGIS